MRKWEEKYKELQSGKLDTRIGELQQKFDNKSITREELKEFEKAKKIKENMSKIENIAEYKEKLEGQLKELEAEQDRRKSLVDLEKEAKKLDGELSRLNFDRAVAERELKTPDLSDNKRAEIEARLAGVKEKMNKNQEAFSKNQLTIAATSKAGGKLAELPDEELQAKRTNISTKISKCHMICRNLIEGYSWDSIDMQLEQWQGRKLTSKKETAEKMRQSAKEDKKEKAERPAPETKKEEKAPLRREETKTERPIATPIPEAKKDEQAEQKEDNEEKSLVEVSEFDKKHPRLAKIKNFFKRMGQSIKNTFTDKEEDLEQLDKEAEGEEKKEEAQEKKEPVNKTIDPEVKAKEEADDFRAYIKSVAEKGMREADKERLEAKREALKQKMAEQGQREDKSEKDDMER